MPENRAERLVRSSQEWAECQARAKANELKVELEYIGMRHSEWQSAQANARGERGI